MSWATARPAEQGSAQWCYQRRRPEQALLYQLVETYYSEFLDVLSVTNISAARHSVMADAGRRRVLSSFT